MMGIRIVMGKFRSEFTGLKNFQDSGADVYGIVQFFVDNQYFTVGIAYSLD